MLSSLTIEMERIAKGLGAAGLVMMGAGMYAALLWAPPDEVQGNVQRIMYLHAPTAWVAYLAFFIVFLFSLVYLLKRERRWDAVAHSSAEIGVLFTALAIITGSIWGKPTWGTWWTWDARLTTTAILLFIYIGYLMLRSFALDPAQGARYAAVVGIVGFLDIPIIHMSVVWWRTLHQAPSLIRPGGPTVAPSMLLVLFLNLLAFTLIFFHLLLRRIRLEGLKERREGLIHG